MDTPNEESVMKGNKTLPHHWTRANPNRYMLTITFVEIHRFFPFFFLLLEGVGGVATSSVPPAASVS